MYTWLNVLAQHVVFVFPVHYLDSLLIMRKNGLSLDWIAGESLDPAVEEVQTGQTSSSRRHMNEVHQWDSVECVIVGHFRFRASNLSALQL